MRRRGFALLLFTSLAYDRIYRSSDFGRSPCLIEQAIDLLQMLGTVFVHPAPHLREDRHVLQRVVSCTTCEELSQ